jgi:hypothetical protein
MVDSATANPASEGRVFFLPMRRNHLRNKMKSLQRCISANPARGVQRYSSTMVVSVGPHFHQR